MKSPCRDCKAQNAPDCRRSCKRLNEFQIWLDHQPVMTGGVVDTAGGDYHLTTEG